MLEFEPRFLGVASAAARQTLHQIIDQLPDDELSDVLEHLSWVLCEEDTLTTQEFFRARDGAQQIMRGDFVALEDLPGGDWAITYHGPSVRRATDYVQVARQAADYIRDLDLPIQRRILGRLAQIAEDPYGVRTKLLTNGEGRRSRQEGGRRIVFRADEAERILQVDDVGPRGQIYREAAPEM